MKIPIKELAEITGINITSLRHLLGHYTLTRHTIRCNNDNKYPTLCVIISKQFIYDFLYYLCYLRKRKMSEKQLEQITNTLEKLNSK